MVRVTGVTCRKRWVMGLEEAERAIRRRLGVMAVRCQASSLLGRLETLHWAVEVQQEEGGGSTQRRLREVGEGRPRLTSCLWSRVGESSGLDLPCVMKNMCCDTMSIIYLY